MKRYVFIGSVDYSAYCLRELLKMGVNIVDIMCPSQEVSRFNSDYFNLGEVARDFRRNVHYFSKIAEEGEHIKEKRPDIVFVLGLSQIIPKHILQIPTIGCIGSHPSLLPQNRGRHPIIWAIANGLKKSGITLFWIDEDVDAGDIWDQREFVIDILDDASSIYKKVKELTVEMLEKNLPDLERGIVRRVKQIDSQANYWRRRTCRDGEIDWRMSSRRIYDLVRALTRPYPGAHCLYKGQEIKIWKVRMLNDNIQQFNNLEPGKVISVDCGRITVKTGDELVEIIEHDFVSMPKPGDYLDYP